MDFNNILLKLRNIKLSFFAIIFIVSCFLFVLIVFLFFLFVVEKIYNVVSLILPWAIVLVFSFLITLFAVDFFTKKRRVKTLSKETIKLFPLNKEGRSEELRKALISNIIVGHGQERAQEIINSGRYGVSNLIPQSPIISVYSKNNENLGVFLMRDGKLESMDTVNRSLEAGNTLYS
jgi:energy-coupling factor transporter transmembrane protein EcfT